MLEPLKGHVTESDALFKEAQLTFEARNISLLEFTIQERQFFEIGAVSHLTQQISGAQHFSQHFNLSLVYNTLFDGMDEFVGILHSQHVVGTVFINEVYHGCKSSGLSLTCCSCYQNQALMLVKDLFDHGRKPQLIKGWGVKGYNPEACVYPLSLIEDISPKSTNTLDLVAEIELIIPFEFLALLRGQDLVKAVNKA